MADSLQRLVNIGSFTILQEKIEKWLDDYKINTCDQNVAKACEIIELNARVQGQLFKLLSICASEGGLYGGAAVIRSRLLPLLGHGFFASGLSSDASLSILAEAASKTHEVSDVRRAYENSLDELDKELRKSKLENDDLRNELSDTKMELDRQSRASASEKMFNDAEIRDLRLKLNQAEAENERLKSQSHMMDDYDRQLRLLRNEVNFLQGKKECLSPPCPASLPQKIEPDLSETIHAHRYHHGRGSVSPISLSDPIQRSRQQNLIARFNDNFSISRLDAMDILRRYIDDHENNQRILFAAVQEAFNAAKIAFRTFKSKVRSQLLMSHLGPETLEEAVQDFINCHSDHYDLQSLIQDVLRALNRNYRIYLPPGVGFDVLSSFIRDACRIAWEMSSLAHPIDIAAAHDSELYDDQKYRRSYDSEFTAPLVSHHIWPCLVQNANVVMKGEACTRRGASYTPRGRSISRSSRRATSPNRSVSPNRPATPVTKGRTPRSNRARTPDPMSTTRTASTSLSHYMS